MSHVHADIDLEASSNSSALAAPTSTSTGSAESERYWRGANEFGTSDPPVSMLATREAVERYKYWAAPMVGMSELAFRMHCRSQGATMASTPMVDAGGFAHSATYRNNWKFAVCGDRPLIFQMAGRDVEPVRAATVLVDQLRLPVDAVELNVGCPQACAKKNQFGAFLMDDTPEKRARLDAMLRAMVASTRLPVFVKIRVFDTYEQTRAYVLFLQETGIKCITIHSRTRKEKREAAVRARWHFVRKLCEDPAVRVPIVSNGDIRCLEDVHRCLKETGAAGVMSATSLLRNPALFASQERPPALQLSLQYLVYAERYGAEPIQVSQHLNQMLSRRARRHCPRTVDMVQTIGLGNQPDYEALRRALLDELGALPEYELRQPDYDPSEALMCPFYLEDRCKYGGLNVQCHHDNIFIDFNEQIVSSTPIPSSLGTESAPLPFQPSPAVFIVHPANGSLFQASRSSTAFSQTLNWALVSKASWAGAEATRGIQQVALSSSALDPPLPRALVYVAGTETGSVPTFVHVAFVPALFPPTLLSKGAGVKLFSAATISQGQGDFGELVPVVCTLTLLGTLVYSSPAEELVFPSNPLAQRAWEESVLPLSSSGAAPHSLSSPIDAMTLTRVPDSTQNTVLFVISGNELSSVRPRHSTDTVKIHLLDTIGSASSLSSDRTAASITVVPCEIKALCLVVTANHRVQFVRVAPNVIAGSWYLVESLDLDYSSSGSFSGASLVPGSSLRLSYWHFEGDTGSLMYRESGYPYDWLNGTVKVYSETLPAAPDGSTQPVSFRQRTSDLIVLASYSLVSFYSFSCNCLRLLQSPPFGKFDPFSSASVTIAPLPNPTLPPVRGRAPTASPSVAAPSSPSISTSPSSSSPTPLAQPTIPLADPNRRTLPNNNVIEQGLNLSPELWALIGGGPVLCCLLILIPVLVLKCHRKSRKTASGRDSSSQRRSRRNAISMRGHRSRSGTGGSGNRSVRGQLRASLSVSRLSTPSIHRRQSQQYLAAPHRPKTNIYNPAPAMSPLPAAPGEPVYTALNHVNREEKFY